MTTAGSDRAFAAVGDGHRPAQGAGRPGVVGYHGEGRGDHGDRGGARHRRRHSRRDGLAAVDALAVVADRAVDGDQPGGLRRAARREDAEGGRAHGQSIAPGVPVLGGDGRGEAPAEVLQGAAFAEAGAPERALVQVSDPLVPRRLHMRDSERGAVPGQQQPGEDGVLGVVRARGMLGHVSRDAPPARADLGGFHVLGGRPQRVPDSEPEHGSACPLAEAGGVPRRRNRRNADDGRHMAPLWPWGRSGPVGSRSALEIRRCGDPEMWRSVVVEMRRSRIPL